MSAEDDDATVLRKNKLLIDAMTKIMLAEMDKRFEAQQSQTHAEASKEKDTNERSEGGQRDSNREETARYYGRSDHSQRSQRRTRRDSEERNPRIENLKGLKIKIPEFLGKNDPDAYLDWEKKIELVFNCQEYADINRVKVAATEFNGYALSWWDQVVTTRMRLGENPIDSWALMKQLMRKRFVPSHYQRDLHSKLRRLIQGSKSVEDYYQEMETLLLRADILKGKEASMSRFLGGLNKEIQDRVEMQDYEDLEGMLHKAILVEQQLKKKSYTWSSYGTSSSQSSYQRDGKSATTSRVEYKPSSANFEKDKSKIEVTPTRTRDLKCFKCKGIGHYASNCTN